MDKSFNFSDLLRMQTHENKHKVKPTQFISVAGGVKKRLETNINNKRRTRLTNFDNFRNLPKCATPLKAPLSKVEQRMMQLQKWKVEKEKKKTEANAQKKKPFVVGVVKNTLKFEPPPSISWPQPSSSGRVTRSQSTRNKVTNNEREIPKSFKFAPKNATFNPVLKDLPMPSLSAFGDAKSGPQKDCKVKSPKNALKPELRSLRSRTKLSDNTNIKKIHNQSSASSTTDLNTRKKHVPKNKPTKKPTLDINDTKLKQTYSSSSGFDSHEEEILIAKVKSITKMNKQGKGKKLVNSTQKENTKIISANTEKENKSNISTSTESDVENPPNTPKTPKSLKISLTRLKLNISLNASINTENLVNLSNYSSSMETDVAKPPNTPQNPRRSTKTTNTPNQPNTTTQDFITFTPKNPVPKSESSSEEKLRSPKSIDAPMTPQQITEEAKKISPRVYLSRGKENTRKEMKKRIDDGLLDDDVCDMSVDHFRKQLDSEIKRMTEMCDTWDRISEQTTLPDEIQEVVLAALGQARLLMSQKMQQFASLVRRCERPESGQALVTRGDLQGFWDMVFMQVEDVDMRFKKLEQSRARGWAEEQPSATAVPQKKKPPPQPKPPVRASRIAASNHLKDVIAAARRAKKALEANTKTFEAGFFSVQSPVKAAAALVPATPVGKPSLLKCVLSSEAKKASAKKSSIAMLRASSIGKYMDSEDSPSYEANLALTPINYGATPGKSILKSNNNTATKAASKISFKLFADDDIIETASTQTGEERELSDVQKSEKLQNLDTSYVSPNPVTLNSEKLQNLKISASSPNTVDSSVTMDAEKVKEGKENRRTSRRKLKLERQDAVEESTPVMTRSRRKTIQTPASENLDIARSSRRKKTLVEVNEVKLAVTPSTTRSRRLV